MISSPGVLSACRARSKQSCSSLFCLFALVFLTQCGSAHATDQTYDRCIDASDGTNSAWSLCGGNYVKRLDAQLNDVWKQVFPELTAEGQVMLRTEQLSWNAFKEGSCLYYSNGDYGREGQVMHMPLCRAEIIEQRISYLHDLNSFVSSK